MYIRWRSSSLVSRRNVHVPKAIKILTKDVISGIVNFRDIILESSRNVSEKTSVLWKTFRYHHIMMGFHDTTQNGVNHWLFPLNIFVRKIYHCLWRAFKRLVQKIYGQEWDVLGLSHYTGNHINLSWFLIPPPYITNTGVAQMTTSILDHTQQC